MFTFRDASIRSKLEFKAYFDNWMDGRMVGCIIPYCYCCLPMQALGGLRGKASPVGRQDGPRESHSSYQHLGLVLFSYHMHLLLPNNTQ